MFVAWPFARPSVRAPVALIGTPRGSIRRGRRRPPGLTTTLRSVTVPSLETVVRGGGSMLSLADRRSAGPAFARLFDLLGRSTATNRAFRLRCRRGACRTGMRAARTPAPLVDRSRRRPLRVGHREVGSSLGIPREFRHTGTVEPHLRGGLLDLPILLPTRDREVGKSGGTTDVITVGWNPR